MVGYNYDSYLSKGIDYKIGSAIDSLATISSVTREIEVNFKPNTYIIKYDKGNSEVLGTMGLEPARQYDKEYTVAENYYSYNAAHPFIYWVVDSIVDKDGKELDNYKYDRDRYLSVDSGAYPNKFYNITEIDGAIVTLKAVWSNIDYKVQFDKNLPEGRELTNETKDFVMATISYVSGRESEKPIPECKWDVKGYDFLGWNVATNSLVPIYASGSELVGVAREENDLITLYAVWRKSSGVIHVLAGHNSDKETIVMDTNKDYEGFIPSIAEMNNSGKALMYYRLVSMCDVSGNEYELTEEELLHQIKVGDIASMIIREEGDIATISAVYREPYKVVYDKGSVIDKNGKERVKIKKQVSKEAYINDYVVIADEKFETNGGYEFANYYKDSEGNIFKPGEIFESLSDTEDSEYILTAVYTPINYAIIFDKGNTNAVGEAEMVEMVFDEGIAISSTSIAEKFVYADYEIEYLVTDYLMKFNEEQDVEWIEDIGGSNRKKIALNDEGYYEFLNLTDVKDGVVIVKLVWSDIPYTVNFYPAVPEGYTLDEDVTMDSINLIGSQSEVVPKSAYSIRGFNHIGWSKKQGADTVLYEEGDLLFGLAAKDNDVINLYAVWERQEGDIRYIPGNKSSNKEVTVSTKDNKGLIVAPATKSNTDGKQFSHYMIDQIIDKDGNVLELTKEEKFKRIQEGSFTNVLLRNDGDLVVLKEIYNERYTVVISAGTITDKDRFVHRGSPSNAKTQTVYVGERVEIPNDIEYSMDYGYKYNKTFTGTLGTTKRTFNAGDTPTDIALRENVYYTITPNYDPIKYYIDFDKGPTAASGTMQPQEFLFDEEKELSLKGYFNGRKGFEYWVLEQYQYADGQIKEDIKRATFSNQQKVHNLAREEGTRVKLKAVWEDDITYVRFNSNVPTGFELSNTSKNMENLTLTGGEKKSLIKNTYDVKGYRFIGWGTTSTATKIKYQDEEVVYALGRNSGDIIDLYAVWEKLYGTVTIRPGMNAKTSETSLTFSTNDLSGKLPSPSEIYRQNANGADFVYYIIESIQPLNSSVNYTLTQEENLIKIYPGIEMNTLLRKQGDKVTLTKIYDEAYEIQIKANTIIDLDNNSIVPEPKNYIATQSVRINDRATLSQATYSMPYGYKFTGQFTYQNKIYKSGDLIRNIRTTKGIATFLADFKAINYYIDFDKGDVSAYGTMRRFIAEYDRNTRLPQNMYNSPNGDLEYYVLDKITLPDGTILKDRDIDRKKFIYRNNFPVTSFRNIANIENAVVTLKAVWSELNYSIIFNPNVPTGYSLDVPMSTRTQYFIGSQSQALYTNRYRIQGFAFEGWATSANAEKVLYDDEEVVYGLANRKGQVINLYAVWMKLEGFIGFDSGHNGTYPLSTISTADYEYLPEPVANRNSSERGFLYYIIDYIENREGERYELTDSEKAMQLVPNIKTSLLIKKAGDQVRLKAIYNESYKIVYASGSIIDKDGILHSSKPDYVEDIVIVNDRFKITTQSFVMENGYKFNNTFKYKNKLYKLGDYIESITDTITNIDNYIIPITGGDVEPAAVFVAQYDPITYNINFDPGNKDATVIPSNYEIKNIKFDEDRSFDRNPVVYQRQNIDYYVVDKITRKNGTVVPMTKEMRKKVGAIPVESKFRNLTDIDEATVTLKAVWKGIGYKVKFDPNLPAGYKLNSKSKKVEDVNVVGGEDIVLPENTYVLNGNKFIGWTDVKTDKEPKYQPGDVMYGLGKNTNDEVLVYAVWDPYDGRVEFDTGYNAYNSDIMNPVETDDNNQGIIPKPELAKNKNQKPFVYYVIEERKNENGEIVALTNEEKLEKIYPETPIGAVLTSPSQTVVLKKIYEDYYTIILSGSLKKDLGGMYHKGYVLGNPNEVEVEMRVNVGDRATISNVNFVMDAYRFRNSFEDVETGRVYNIGDFIEDLRTESKTYVDFKALYNPITYRVTFDSALDKDVQNTMTMVTGREYDTKYNLTDPIFTYNGKKPVYFIVDGIEYGSKKYTDLQLKNLRTKVERDLNYEYFNLTTISNATVTLKAVWEDVDYTVAFAANLPAGKSLAESITMDPVTVKGGDALLIPESEYKVNEYSFVGWSTNRNDTIPIYYPGDKVYGLLSKGNTSKTINMYAIWEPIKGTIVFDSGHRSSEVIPNMDTMLDNNGILPNHNKPNDDGYEFSHYIIDKIVSKDGSTKYSLTDEEKMMKIDPKNNIKALTLLRKPGDTVYLKKIYKEEYDLIYKGGSITNSEGQIIEGEPTEVVRKIYINDRVKIESLPFSIEAYAFDEIYLDKDGKEYRAGQIVDKFTENVEERIELTAQYSPLKYSIEFLPGIVGVAGNKLKYSMNYNEARSLLPVGYTYGSNELEYWLWEKTTDRFGKETIYKGDDRKKFEKNASVINLTTMSNATLTFRAVWKNVPYHIIFDPNVPKGENLSSKTKQMDKQDFVGGEEKNLYKNQYSVRGYSFIGWATNSETTTVSFSDEEKVFALSSKYNEDITLYAVWSRMTGKIKILPGHNSSSEEVEFDAASYNEGILPEGTNNDDSREFLHYRIYSIKNSNGQEYSLTDEEKYNNILPGTLMSVLLRNEKDTVSLIKIYDEPFNIKYNGSTKTSMDGTIYEASPSSVIRQINVNERHKIEDIQFKMERGYNFSDSYTYNNRTYVKGNEIIFDVNMGDTVELEAVYTPIKYNVKFNKGSSLASGVISPENNREYDRIYNIRTSGFYSSYPLKYFIVDEIQTADGEKLADIKRATVTNAYYNLTDIDGATVTLRAVWGNMSYDIKFDPNVPENAELNQETISMENQTVPMDETTKLNKNIYSVRGYEFLGWNTDKNAKDKIYDDEDYVYALAKENRVVVTLYAIWRVLGGTIQFDSGHLAHSGDKMNPITTSDNDGLIPAPEYRTNSINKNFAYYIIDKIVNYKGDPIELTDSDKELKINPGYESSKLIQNNGDVVTLKKIYSEPYSITFRADDITDRSSNVIKVSPSEEKLYFNVNDRIKIPKINYSIDYGYKFSNKFRNIYNIYDEYEEEKFYNGIGSNEGEEYEFVALFEPITYTITFDAGNGAGTTSNQSGTYDTQGQLSATTLRKTNDSIEYFVVDKIILSDKTEITNAEKVKVQNRGSFINLSKYDNSTVVLRAIWLNAKYQIKYNANVPEGAMLEDPTVSGKMVDVVGGEDVVLPSDEFIVSGYKLKGWNTISATTSVLYKPGDTVYGLSRRDNEIVNLYAIWEEKVGTIVFDAGNRPQFTRSPMRTDQGSGLITRFANNVLGNPFKYFIIKSITDADGNDLTLTESELYRKIYHGEKANTLLRESGQTVEIIAIYDETYTLRLKGMNEWDEYTQKQYVSTPEYYDQKMYINDRATLSSPDFYVDGYKFEYEFTDIFGQPNVKIGANVEALSNLPGDIVEYYAEFTPNTHSVKYDKGSDLAQEVNGGMPQVDNKEFGKIYDVDPVRFTLENNNLEYFVVDKIVDKDGSPLPEKDVIRQKVTILDGYKNLTSVDGAVVTLKAVWNNVKYKVLFNPNVPNGYELDDKEQKIDALEFVGGEEKTIPDEEYKIKGFKFIGWGINANSTSAQFNKGDVLYGLGRNDGEVINLYAIWQSMTGTIAFVRGHYDSEQLNSISLNESEVKLAPTPTLITNSTGDEFVYYIIDHITNIDGVDYQLTNDELVKKIPAGTPLNTLLRNAGDTVYLKKIFNEPYIVSYRAGQITDADGNIIYGSPDNIEREVYINERIVVEGFDFTINSGYEYLDEYEYGLERSTTKYNCKPGDIVNGLGTSKNSKVIFTPKYKPITYTIQYIPGIEGTTRTISPKKATYDDKSYVLYSGYTVPNSNYRLDYFVVEKIETPNGHIITGEKTGRKQVRLQEPIYNLTTISEAIVTMKGVWTNTTYDIVFNPNVPRGLTLTGKTTMDRQTITAGNREKLHKNEFAINEYKFMGWATTAGTTSIAYEDEAYVYGLANKDKDVINLYAVWQKLSGTIRYNPGNDSSDSISDTASSESVKQSELTNNSGARFLYYIIDKMTNENGIEYELTKDELLRKIYPGENINDIVRNNGDIITLIKIYEEEYSVIYPRDVRTDIDGGSHIINPDDIEETTYINDRYVIASLSYISETGYTFNNTFISEVDEKIYTAGDIVRNLTRNSQNSSILIPNVTPISYTVSFDRGNSKATGNMGVMTNIKFDQEVLLTNIGFSYRGNTIDYFVVDSIMKSDGTYITLTNKERKKITVGSRYHNLTEYNNAIVTLKAVWSNVKYDIVLHANVPENAELLSDISISTVSVTGGAEYTMEVAPFRVKGYNFVGWATSSTTGKVGYVKGDTIYGISTEDDQIINLYAVWESLVGYIAFSPGHNNVETIPTVDTNYNAGQLLYPVKRTNDAGKEFSHYIIESIKDKDGNFYELTDRELREKIYPGAITKDYIREHGDTVTLLKIFKEAYTIIVNGQEYTDTYGNIFKSSPEYYSKVAYVNDRVQLIDDVFTMPNGGYKFTGNIYVESKRQIYKYDTLDANWTIEGAVVTGRAMFDPITYNVIFDKGNDNAVSNANVIKNVAYGETRNVNPNITYQGHQLLAFKVEKMEYENGEVVPKDKYEETVITRGTTGNYSFSNLISIDGVTVTLKALWDSVSYRLRFNPNVPAGYTAIGTMDYQNFKSTDRKAITKNVYEIKGLEFKGWSLSRDSSNVDYKDEEVIIGLGTKDDDIIDLYAVWGIAEGTIVYQEGHLGIQARDPQKTADNSFVEAGMEVNNNGDPFVYYIIQRIVDKNNQPYTLTEEEMMKKVYAGDDARSLLRNPGDTVVLLKIYQEPYNVVVNVNNNDPLVSPVPSGYSTQIFINDRVILNIPKFTLDGYRLLSVRGEDGLDLSTSHVVQNLKSNKNETYYVNLTWESATYNVVYDKGVEDAYGSMPAQNNLKYSEIYSLPNERFRYDNHELMYFVVDKIQLSDGRYLPNGDFERRIVRSTFSELSEYGGSTVTLKAVWSMMTYDIVFNPNVPNGKELTSDSIQMENQHVESGESTLLNRSTYFIKGYKQIGWATYSSATQKAYDLITYANGMADVDGAVVNLYAIWQPISYRVVFDPSDDDYEGTIEDTGIKYYDISYQLPTVHTQSGKAIEYFVVDKVTDAYGVELNKDTYERKIVNLNTSYSNLIDRDNAIVTLKAVWSNLHYEIRFNINLPIGTLPANGSIDMLNQQFVGGEKQNLRANTYKINYYTFKGWATASNLSRIAYQNKQEVYGLGTKEGDIINLYAVWEKMPYDIVYLAGHNGVGSINNPASIDVAANPDGSDSEGVGIRNSYNKEFMYWAIDSIVTNTNTNIALTTEQKIKQIYPGDSLSGITTIENTTVKLIAIYKEAYTVVLDGNPPISRVEGTNITSPSNIVNTYYINGRYKMPENTMKMELPGYKLRGYSLEANGNVTYDENSMIDRMTNTEGDTIRLYAQWTAITYSITFETGASDITGSTVAMNNLVYDLGYYLSSMSFIYDKNKYEFSGWRRSKIKTADKEIPLSDEKVYINKDYIYNLSTYDNSEVVMTAIWKGGTYDIVVDANGGGKRSNGDTQYIIKANRGETVNIPANIFTANSSNTYVSSYNTKADGTGTRITPGNQTSDLTIDTSITIYAIWTRNSSGNNQGSGSSGSSSGGNRGGGSNRTGGSSIGIPDVVQNNGPISIVGNNLNTPQTQQPQQPTVQTTYMKGTKGGRTPASAVRVDNQGSWVEDKSVGKWKYAGNSSNVVNTNIQDNSVDYLNSGFYQITWNGASYIFDFDEQGYMKTGFTEADGKIYYLLDTTENQGALASGNISINGNYYSFNEDGTLKKENESVLSVAGGKWEYEPTANKWRYLTSSTDIAGQRYLSGDIFHIYSGQGDDYYAFDEQGYMRTGYIDYKGNTYYMLESGNNQGALSFTKNNNESYYFNEQGTLMAVPRNNTETTGWLLNVNNNSVQYIEQNQTGQVMPLANTYRRLYSNGGYYDFIFDSLGNMKTGLTEFNGNVYYLEENGINKGAVTVGERIINGTKYIFGNDGTLQKAEGLVYSMTGTVWR